MKPGLHAVDCRLMAVLLVTDHRFTRVDGSVADIYRVGADFFRDYRSVFGEVVVCARVADAGGLPPGAPLAEGPGLRFAGVKPRHGPLWWLGAPFLSRHVIRLLQGVDAAVVRVPMGVDYQIEFQTVGMYAFNQSLRRKSRIDQGGLSRGLVAHQV